jgi:hypothetical protein
MSKLGISKNELLANPKIKLLYQQYMKQKGKGKMRGSGLFDNFVQFLKDSKILSTVGNVVLPVAGTALGTLVSANPLVGAAAGAAGVSANQWLKSQGFGKKPMMRGGDNRLVINPPGTRLGQKGTKIKGGCGCGKMRGGAVTYGINGVYQQIPGTLPGTAIGIVKQKGTGGTAFNSISSEFGNIKV